MTDDGVWSTTLEIFDTGAKIPSGHKKKDKSEKGNLKFTLGQLKISDYKSQHVSL